MGQLSINCSKPFSLNFFSAPSITGSENTGLITKGQKLMRIISITFILDELKNNYAVKDVFWG